MLEPEWQAPPPEPEPVPLGEPAAVGDELDLDEFAIGETDEFAFEDEDFFGDDLDVPRPSTHEPPIEPFPGPPAPTLEPPAPDPEPFADPHRADRPRSPRPPATPPGGFPAADPGASPDQGDPLADSEPESHRPPEADQPTQQYSVADVDEATRHRPSAEPESGGEEETPEGEDLLEETPEFLEETPEHDRLWFEQKPPRDFDF